MIFKQRATVTEVSPPVIVEAVKEVVPVIHNGIVRSLTIVTLSAGIAIICANALMSTVSVSRSVTDPINMLDFKIGTLIKNQESINGIIDKINERTRQIDINTQRLTIIEGRLGSLEAEFKSHERLDNRRMSGK